MLSISVKDFLLLRLEEVEGVIAGMIVAGVVEAFAVGVVVIVEVVVVVDLGVEELRVVAAMSVD